MNARDQQGYAMAALLVALAVMAVLATAVMPAWRQMARREQEAELVFRGEQYARAIGLFQRRAGPGVLPPSVDALVEGRFLRRAYKDPITNQDFEFLRVNTDGSAITSSSNRSGGQGGGIMGVSSRSTAESLREYNGATHYNEWFFTFTPQVQNPASGQGGRGGQNEGRTGRGGRGQGTGDTPPARSGGGQTPSPR
jgi:type II secretory pathway pseudopilin PulG